MFIYIKFFQKLIIAFVILLVTFLGMTNTKTVTEGLILTGKIMFGLLIVCPVPALCLKVEIQHVRKTV